MDNVDIVHIHIQIMGQEIFGLIGHHALCRDPVDVHNAGKFAKTVAAQFRQHKVRVIFNIHGRRISPPVKGLCDPKHKIQVAIMQLYYHETCQAHDMGPGHPESPSRLRAVRDAVCSALDSDVLLTPAAASHEALARAHTTRHVDRLFAAAPREGCVQLDPDTSMNPFSLAAARFAAGALVDATAAVVDGATPSAFCMVRPPGHHAERDRVMGFCLFNSIAVGALHALDDAGLQRVAILDFDVHHGNGTEDIFRHDKRVLFCSSYQHPFYPYTNAASIDGHLINVPLAAGTGSAAFRNAITHTWLRALREFKPQLLLVSAGFDAHEDDPLGGLCLTDADYAWLGTQIGSLADELCAGRVVATLEGGYDLAALGRSAVAFCTALRGDSQPI